MNSPNILLEHDDRPVLVEYNLFDADESEEIMSLMLGKRVLKWKQYKLKTGQTQPRLSLAFSHGWRYRYLGVDMNPYPINKHLDIFDKITSRIRDVLMNIKSKKWMSCDLNEKKGPDYWLCHWYRDGRDSIASHSDDETDLEPGTPIISISFGASRKFIIRDKEGKKILTHEIKNGTVVIMLDPMQKNYKHEIPKDEDCYQQRLNMTGRFIRKRH